MESKFNTQESFLDFYDYLAVQFGRTDEDDANVEEADHEDFEKIERIIRESTMFV